MEQARQIHELMEAVGPFEMVSVGSPGAEYLVIVMDGVAAVRPRGRRHQVKPVQGSVTLVCYIRQQDRLRWALAEEDAERSRWLAFHAWSEVGSRWLHQILFRTLKQARRGHRVRCLHGRRMSISYSVGLEDQLVLVKEMDEEHLWWVFYVEGPDGSLVHMVSLRVSGASLTSLDQSVGVVASI